MNNTQLSSMKNKILLDSDFMETCFRCCKYLNDGYWELFMMIQNKRSFEEVVVKIVDIARNLLQGNISHQQLIIHPDNQQHILKESFDRMFRCEREKVGNVVDFKLDDSGFIIVKDLTTTIVGKKLRLIDKYNRTYGPLEEIDYKYYLENIAMIYIDGLFASSFQDIINKLPHVSYRPSIHSRIIYLNQPIKIIIEMHARGYDVNEFANAVKYNYQQFIHDNNNVVQVSPSDNIDQRVSSSNIETKHQNEKECISDTKLQVSPCDKKQDKISQVSSTCDPTHLDNVKQDNKRVQRKKQKQKRKEAQKAKRLACNAIISVSTDSLAVWSLDNPGPWDDIATEIMVKYKSGLAKHVKMKYTPEQCFKMAVTEMEKAPDNAKLNVCVDEDMSYVAFWAF